MSRFTIVAAAACLVGNRPAPRPPSPALLRPASAAATHKHYERPTGRPAGPRRRAGAAAAEPRHAHVPGDDDERRRAALHQPGTEPGLRLQPRRGPARVPRGGAARSDPGDGLLGPGAGARPEHQRGDGAQRRAARRRAGAEGALARAAGARRASARSSTRSATRYSGRADQRVANDQAYADAMRAVHEQFPDDLDIADALRRVDDGPAAVGLLDARRPPARRHRGDRRPHRGRDAPQPEPSGRAAHVHPPGGGDGRPSGPRAPPTRCCR